MEPLSWDVSDIFAQYPYACFRLTKTWAITWVKIGAASNGNIIYQPHPGHVQSLLTILDQHKITVFYKGNLKGNPVAVPWREEFPLVE